MRFQGMNARSGVLSALDVAKPSHRDRDHAHVHLLDLEYLPDADLRHSGRIKPIAYSPTLTAVIGLPSP